MRKNSLVIFAVGLAAGLLDLIPLVMVKAPVFNMIAIIIFWLVAVLIMLPVVLTVYTVNPKDFVPMLSMAVILGPLSGAAVRRGLDH